MRMVVLHVGTGSPAYCHRCQLSLLVLLLRFARNVAERCSSALWKRVVAKPLESLLQCLSTVSTMRLHLELLCRVCFTRNQCVRLASYSASEPGNIRRSKEEIAQMRASFIFSPAAFGAFRHQRYYMQSNHADYDDRALLDASASFRKVNLQAIWEHIAECSVCSSSLWITIDGKRGVCRY